MQELDDYFSEDPDMIHQGNQNQRNQNSGYQNQGGYNNNRNFNNNNQGGYNKGNYQGGNHNFNNGGGYQKKSFGGFSKDKEVDLTNYTLYKPFSIFCNDNAPPEILARAKDVLLFLYNHGFTTRASCLTGSEKQILEYIPKDKLELYIPWKDFDNRDTKFYFNDKVSQHVAKMFHKSYDTLKPPVQAFLAKNVRMILGEKAKSRTSLIIVWSEDGAADVNQVTFKTGNISHPIAVASAVHIPVFNLQNPDILSLIAGYLHLKGKTNNE